MRSIRPFLWTFICTAALALLPAPGLAAPPAHAASASPAVLADSWSWGEFCKYWKRQFGKTSGVVGMVLLVGAGAMVIIITRARR